LKPLAQHGIVEHYLGHLEILETVLGIVERRLTILEISTYLECCHETVPGKVEILG
jgi:hypothetical protein